MSSALHRSVAQGIIDDQVRRDQEQESRYSARRCRESVVDESLMHYAFDRWIRREMPECRFARHADDAVVPGQQSTG
jgi:hypothetical protein